MRNHIIIKRVAKTVAASILLLNCNNFRAQVLNYTVAPFVDQAKLYGFSGDGGPALNAKITMPYLGTYDNSGNFYFSDAMNYRVRKVDNAGIISTIGGNGTSAYSGDGGPFNACQMSSPGYLTKDASGNLYISDGSKIRKVNMTTGIITSIAGTGVTGFSGDGGPAINAQLTGGTIKCDGAGNVYFIDGNASIFTLGGSRIRKINITTGVITSIAGTGVLGYSGDGALATTANITASDIEVDASGNVYIIGAYRIRKIDAVSGIISTIAGNGVMANSGDGGLALNSQISSDKIVFDNSGNLLVADFDNVAQINTIRKINSSGIINTVINVYGAFAFMKISKLDIDPISGYPIATFGAICMIDAAVYKLTPCTITNTTTPGVNVMAFNSGQLCPGSNIQLNAVANNGTYAWSGPNGFLSNLQNPVLTNVSSNQTGVYTVTNTSAQGVTTATTMVNVQPAKILSPKSTSTVCEGGTIYLDPNDGAGNAYQWTGPNGFVSISPNAAVQDVVNASTGVYTLTMLDNNGCASYGVVSSLVFTKPGIDIDMSNAKVGCSPVSADFKALGSPDITEYSWSFGNGSVDASSNPKNISYSNAGTYSIILTVSNVNGCTNNISKTLEVHPTPIADFLYTSNANYSNPEVKFTDKSYNGNIVNWYWTFGDALNGNSNQQNPNYNYQDSGKYNVSLKVKTDKGCESLIMKKINVADELDLFVPNGFSPNGDGQNDIFLAVSNNVTKFDMQIFNRGGNVIFHSSDIHKGWDGTYKGQISEGGVFVYKIVYLSTKDSKSRTLTGSVTLVR